MSIKLTQTIEDYLKAIYDITTLHDRASTNQIAEKLSVTPASVTGMIKKLSSGDPPLLSYQRHHGVVLTPDGKKMALKITRQHRLLEMFLHEILGFDWDAVHAEADRLEHFISEEFEERIAQALGNPSHDPHGDPIPTRDLRIPDTPSYPLSELRPGQKAIVHRVGSMDPNLLRYLHKNGIVPQTTVTVLDYSPFDNNLSLKVGDRNEMIVIGQNVSRLISIEIVN